MKFPGNENSLRGSASHSWTCNVDLYLQKAMRMDAKSRASNDNTVIRYVQTCPHLQALGWDDDASRRGPRSIKMETDLWTLEIQLQLSLIEEAPGTDQTMCELRTRFQCRSFTMLSCENFSLLELRGG